MLQQTQVDKVLGYYARFMARFPDVFALAAASQDEVLSLWSGLGYYSRARNMHKAAKLVVSDFAGLIPDQERALRSLPGIGPYTAGAILSIAFNQPVQLVDGNVERVLARVLALQGDVRSPAHKKTIIAAAKILVQGPHPGDLNQALMELGALQCRPGQVDCSICPIALHCLAQQQGLQQQIPAPRKRARQPLLRMALAVIVDADKILLRRRGSQGLFGGLWEIPAVEILSTDRRQDIARALRRDLKIELKLGRKLSKTQRLLTHRRLQLEAYQVSVLQAPEISAVCQFVAADQLQTWPLSAAMRAVLNSVNMM